MRRANRTILGIAVILLALPFAGRAQEGEDGPALGVARVSLTNGDVTVRRGESGDWVQGEVNAPLVDGDSIATGPGSRAEVQLDHSNLLRLGPDSEVHMASLGSRQFRVQVERGVITYSELRGGEADIDIETPLVAVRPGKNGQYRIEVHGDGEVWIMVRQGEAEVASPAGVEVLKKGKRMIVRAGVEKESDSEFIVTKATPRDEWDEWNQHRDKRLRKSESYRHVSSDIYGAEDLDDHGRWTYVSGYGNCWFPRGGADWAPYRQGRWRYIDYYGWTWVSREPWGWAPYHYGRWFNHASYGWGWYPGAHYSRHYWRPALVGFFGWNSYSGLNVGFGFGVGGHHYPYGHVGWVPLAPGERYHPWYGRRNGGGHNTVIVNNNINIHNGFRNARARNGVNVVAADRFARGLASQPQSLRASELRRATVMRGQIPVVPESQSRGNVVRRSTLRAASGDRGTGRQFFSTNRGRSERPVQRASFQQQRQDVTRSIRSFSETGGRRAGTAGGSTGTAGRVARSRTGTVSSGGTAARSGGVRSTTTAGTTRGQRSRGSQATVSSGTGSTGSVRGSTSATRRSGGAAGFPSASGRSRGASPATANANTGSRRTTGSTRATTGSARATTGSRRATTGSTRATTGSPRATTSTRRSGTTSGSQWRTFSGSRAGSPPATVRSTPDRSATRNRTFRTGDPQVLNGPSAGRTVAPRTNSRVGRGASQTNSSVPRTSARRSDSGTFAPRTRSRANTSVRSNSSNARSGSGSRSAAPRVNSSRSNSRSSGAAVPRSNSRVRSSSGTSSRSSRGRSAQPSRPSRSPSVGRSSAPRRAPSVSRSPSRSSGSYGRARSSAPRSSGGSSRGSIGRSSGGARSSGGGARSSGGGAGSSGGSRSSSGGARGRSRGR